MKKFIKFAFVAAIAAVAGYNVYQSQSVMNGMSDFALANVEALASSNEDGTAAGICYIEQTFGGSFGLKIFCDSRTSQDRIFPCPSSTSYGGYNELMRDRCTK